MTDATSSEEHSERQAGKVPRRRFLRLAGLGVAAAASAGGIYDLLRSDEPADKQPPLPALRGKIAPNPNLAQRTLVVIELTGGNDGLNTVAPLGDGRYHDLRPNVALAATDVVDLGDGMGLHRGLAPLLPQLALLQGVGASASDLSHFEMMQRWWRGDPDGRSNESSGFLGRCCDVVSVGQPIVGVTIGSGAVDPAGSRQFRDAGADSACYNLEVWDPATWVACCPGKSAHVGRERWINGLLGAVEAFGRGNVGSAFVAGLELVPPGPGMNHEQFLASVLEGATFLLDHGIAPLYSPLWPIDGTSYGITDGIPPALYVQLQHELYKLRAARRFPVPHWLICPSCSFMLLEVDFDQAFGLEEACVPSLVSPTA